MVDSTHEYEGFIEIHWTAGSIDEARKISRYLVQERLVAAAQIIPWIESIFMWNNQLDTNQESLVIFKTRIENYAAIKDVISQNCTYQVPEISYIKIDGGNNVYRDWLGESIKLAVTNPN